jgi:PAS domain S-box-containing protein
MLHRSTERNRIMNKNSSGLSFPAIPDWQTTFDAITDYVMVLDRDFRIMRVNAAAIAFFNAPLAKILNNQCYTLMHKTTFPIEECPLSRMIHTRNSERAELYDERRNIWLFVTVDPILDADGEIRYIVHTVRDITRKKQTEEELVKAKEELETTNIALRVLLKNKNDDKMEIEKNIIANIHSTTRPYIDKLKTTRLREDQSRYLAEIEFSLDSIASSFAQKLSSKYFGLSQREIQVACLIRDGKTSKNIAEILNLSTNTVIFHRFNIRTKIGLRNNKMNLRTYLKHLNDNNLL